MIRFNRCIEDFRDFQAGDLPENAVRIETPRTIDDTMKHAAPVCAVLCLIVSLTAFAKVFFCKGCDRAGCGFHRICGRTCAADRA